MLNWWLGKSVEGRRVPDSQDIPETPAPVFAARALKSAIFGTPALADDDTIHYDIGEQKNKSQVASPNRGIGLKRSKSERLSPPKPPPVAIRRPSSAGNLSPTKPQGILLTPGTGTTRRKTVSFGTEFAEKKDSTVGEQGDSDDANPFVPVRSGRKTSFATTLENARERRKERTGGQGFSESQPLLDLVSGTDSKRNSTEQTLRSAQLEKSTRQSSQDLVSSEQNRDMTIDLNEPCSQSGKYWKAEYQSYHDEARSRMLELLKYKQLATSYAKKKDDEAVELTEKLREEQERLINMENKLSRLSAKISSGCANGKEEESPELIKELARQTALAVQYRAEVEDFRAAVEGTSKEKRSSTPRAEHPDRELKKAREQLRELSPLHDELANLRRTLSTTEKLNKKLQEENTKLTQELLHADMRLEKQQEKFDKQLKSSEEHTRRKDDSLRTLQKEYDLLREQSRTSRRDAEHLIKMKADQVLQLKRELASVKGVELTMKELQLTLEKKDVEHKKIVSSYRDQIDELTSTPSEDLTTTTEPENVKFDTTLVSQKPMTTPSRPKTSTDFYSRESHIPVPSLSVTRPAKSIGSLRSMRSETPAGSPLRTMISQPNLRTKPSISALSNITNSNKERSTFQKPDPVRTTPLAFKKSELVLATPYGSRVANLNLSELDLDLPSPEPSLHGIGSARSSHEKKSYSSPRPSIFNIASSPPKPAMVRPRTSGELSRKKSNGDLAGRRNAYVVSTRVSNLEEYNISKARSNLPPERVAAAKARLEQKNAEKKRAQVAQGKENQSN